MTEPLEIEARRLFDRYSLEFVEALNICPWAEKARKENQIQTDVFTTDSPHPEDVAVRIQAMGENPQIEIGFVLFPRFGENRSDFEAFVRSVRESYESNPGTRGVLMAVVPFHPDAVPDTTNAQTLVGFIRATPDPTIQAIRLSTLEHLRRRDTSGTTFMSFDEKNLAQMVKQAEQANAPQLHERVGEANLETVKQRGVDDVQALLADIRKDRNETYARLLEAVSPQNVQDR